VHGRSAALFELRNETALQYLLQCEALYFLGTYRTIHPDFPIVDAIRGPLCLRDTFDILYQTVRRVRRTGRVAVRVTLAVLKRRSALENGTPGVM
jgi:hypothetical protein